MLLKIHEVHSNDVLQQWSFCMKLAKFFVSESLVIFQQARAFLSFLTFFKLGARKLHSSKHKKFFQIVFFYFFSLEVFSRNSLVLRLESSVFWNVRKFHFLKFKKSFFWWNIRSFFRAGFFRRKYKKFFLGKNFED